MTESGITTPLLSPYSPAAPLALHLHTLNSRLGGDATPNDVNCTDPNLGELKNIILKRVELMNLQRDLIELALKNINSFNSRAVSMMASQSSPAQYEQLYYDLKRRHEPKYVPSNPTVFTVLDGMPQEYRETFMQTLTKLIETMGEVDDLMKSHNKKKTLRQVQARTVGAIELQQPPKSHPLKTVA